MSIEPQEGDPPEEGGTTEIDDQPLGVPDDLDSEDAPLPGVPEKEPPAGS
jgi:hypothetical protein